MNVEVRHCENSKKKLFFFGGSGGGGGGDRVGGGQGGCERRIEVVRKFKKKIWGGSGRGGQVGGGVGFVGGFRVQVNAMLGVGGDVGYEPIIEGIVQCIKRYCTIVRKIKKMCVCGGGGGNI